MCGVILHDWRIEKQKTIIMPNMKVQRICPNCRHPNIVEWSSQSVNTYFTCRCGAVLPVGESQRDFQNKTSRNVVTSKGVQTDASSIHLGKLENAFPRRAEELRNHVRSGGKLSGPIEDVAARIWSLSQLWLVFLDGDDFGLTKDRGIYDHVVSMAHTHPRCSIEHEANIIMIMVAASMSNFEIETALNCSVDSVGAILLLNGNFDETYQELVRGRVDPTLRK